MVYIQTPVCVVKFDGVNYTASMSGKIYTETLLLKLIERTKMCHWLIEDDFWLHETDWEVSPLD